MTNSSSRLGAEPATRRVDGPRRRGFTLVEVMIVIAIVVLLFTLALTSSDRVRKAISRHLIGERGVGPTISGSRLGSTGTPAKRSAISAASACRPPS